MRILGLLLLCCLMTLPAVSQQDEEPAGETGAGETRARETADLEEIIAGDNAAVKIEGLKKFLAENPESELRTKALEHLASARAALGDIKLRAGETVEGVELFRLAVKEVPDPPSDDLFSKVLVNIPTNLFLLQQRNAAFDIAEELEERASGDSRKLLRLATFYVGIKYATGARRLAEKALAIQPDDPIAYQTLGIAQRLGFDLAGAAEAYGRALELDPDSLSIKQSLGELKRALGQSAEAEVLFREILGVSPESVPARTGLILSLFDQDKRAEAEDRLTNEISENPSNGFAMIGAANWYAANGEPDLAIAYGKQAVTLEESAVWGYIVMGWAYLSKQKPFDAERMLVQAQRFASLPTLSYELALTHMASGHYFGAAQEIRKHFRVENGKLVTDLDGRIGAEADSFADLVNLERKSFLFTPVSPYEAESDTDLKHLLFFEDSVSSAEAAPGELSQATDRFVGRGGDMRTYRELYSAKRLLDNNKQPEKALELVRSAVEGVEASVKVPVASSAVMADQLYERKTAAAAAGEVVIVPEIEEATLVKILRGRIEELAARSLIANGNKEDAEIRLKRAVSVLPKDSAWWRSSVWRLGQLYESKGDDKKALENYTASYNAGSQSEESRSVIEAVYSRIHGSLDGLPEYLAEGGKPEESQVSLFLKKSSEDPQETVANETPEVVVASDEKKPAGAEPAGEKAVPEDPDAVNTGVPAVAAAGDEGGAPKKIPEDIDLDLIPLNPPSLGTPKTPEGSGNAVVLNVDDDPPVLKDTEPEVTDEPDPGAFPDRTVEEAADTEAAGRIDPADPDATGPARQSIRPVRVVGQSTGPEPEPFESNPRHTEAEQALIAQDVAKIEKEVVEPPGIGGEPSGESPENPEGVSESEGLMPANPEPSLIDLGATRPRIVPPEGIRPLETETAGADSCRLVTSQDRVSLISNGGSFGIVVGLVNYNTAYVLRARSESPEHVSITFEPDIGSLDGRAFFVIKSISEQTGEFKVEFETPCGSKDVLVNVY